MSLQQTLSKKKKERKKEKKKFMLYCKHHKY